MWAEHVDPAQSQEWNALETQQGEECRHKASGESKPPEIIAVAGLLASETTSLPFHQFPFPHSSWDISSPAMDSDSSCGYPFESGLGDVNHRGFGLPGLSTPPSSTLQRGSRWAAENPPRGRVDG